MNLEGPCLPVHICLTTVIIETTTSLNIQRCLVGIKIGNLSSSKQSNLDLSQQNLIVTAQDDVSIRPNGSGQEMEKTSTRSLLHHADHLGLC